LEAQLRLTSCSVYLQRGKSENHFNSIILYEIIIIGVSIRIKY